MKLCFSYKLFFLVILVQFALGNSAPKETAPATVQQYLEVSTFPSKSELFLNPTVHPDFMDSLSVFPYAVSPFRVADGVSPFAFELPQNSTESCTLAVSKIGFHDTVMIVNLHKDTLNYLFVRLRPILDEDEEIKQLAFFEKRSRFQRSKQFLLGSLISSVLASSSILLAEHYHKESLETERTLSQSLFQEQNQSKNLRDSSSKNLKRANTLRKTGIALSSISGLTLGTALILRF